MSAEFGWWVMSLWLNPGAAWFIFFNVIVGAIAVMSSRGQQDGRRSGTQRKLIRTASTVVLDSLRSITIFSFHSAGDYGVACSTPASQLHHVHVQDQPYTFQEEETQEPSMLAPKLREPEAASVAQETVVLPQSAPVAAATALGESATASESQLEGADSSISLDEAYALARARRQSPTDAAAITVATVWGGREPVAEAKVRAYGCGRGTEEVEGKAEVNARAEQFIRQFREELKLERINSILNYTHALRRGAAVVG